jgi:hypothetical protein
MTLIMYWSDSTSNNYYLNFAPNHTFNQRLGSIIHFIATVNTFDHYWKAWYNGISLGTGTIASKTMGYPGAGMFKPFAIVSTQTAGYMLNGTLLGCKISTVEYTSGAMTSTIIIKNPTQALDQTVLGSVLYGHCGGMLERSSKVAVSYSADNITFSSDRSSVPNGKTLYMKAVFTSDGAAGARITGIGLRTAPAGVLLGTNVSERNGRYWINGTYPSLSPTLIPEITVSSAKETSIEALSATGFYLSSADNTTSVDVTVSGLDHLVKYAVTIDGSAWLDYRAVSVAGYYNFTYSGPWSTHYFSLEQYIAPIPVPPEPGPDDTSSGWWLVGVGGIIAVSVIVIMLLANNGSKQTGKKGTGRKHKE